MNCASCGAEVGAADRFCAGCGAPLESGVNQETRKRVSVLFLDIVGSTALAEQLDPEPLRLIMDRYFAACAAAIHDHGGAVEKFIGDAVLAVFGAAAAHEDDAARATRAAVSALGRLRELSAELGARYGVNLEARCGICTGDVVVIMPPGGDFRVVGDAVNTASRLQTAAGPGEILLDADTATMIRGAIGIEPIAPLTLKGKARAVPAWRVTDAAARPRTGTRLRTRSSAGPMNWRNWPTPSGGHGDRGRPAWSRSSGHRGSASRASRGSSSTRCRAMR